MALHLPLVSGPASDTPNIVPSCGHDNYTKIVGGVQLCVALEQAAFAERDCAYINLHPVQPLPFLSPETEPEALDPCRALRRRRRRHCQRGPRLSPPSQISPASRESISALSCTLSTATPPRSSPSSTAVSLLVGRGSGCTITSASAQCNSPAQQDRALRRTAAGIAWLHDLRLRRRTAPPPSSIPRAARPRAVQACRTLAVHGRPLEAVLRTRGARHHGPRDRRPDRSTGRERAGRPFCGYR